METLAELLSIDAVILAEGPTAENIIKIVKPNIYFKGPDYKKHKDIIKQNKTEIKLVNKYKGKIIYTSDEKFSSSNIINENFNVLTEDQKNL